MDKVKDFLGQKHTRVVFFVLGFFFGYIGLGFLALIMFVLAFISHKRYKATIGKTKSAKQIINPEPVKVEEVSQNDKVQVEDLNGNIIEVSTHLQVDGKEDVLITEGGRTFHTSVGCFRNWKPEMQSNFTGWKIIKRKDAIKMGMKYCSFCDEAVRTTIDDLEDLEDED